MNRNLKALALLGALVANSAFASEMRSPWISERGPLRYTFEKLHDEDGKANLNYWSVLHTKGADKAFLKHGTDTKPLSALIFNKSEFALKEIFPNSDVPLNSENFNPFVRTVSISPRVTYFEYGATFGGRWDYPVWGKKGRIGLRGTVPVRRVEMEREDFDDEVLDAGLDGVSFKQVEKITRTTQATAPADSQTGSDGKLAANADFEDVVTRAWRFDFVQSIPNADRTSIVTFLPGSVSIGGGTLISDNGAIIDPAGSPVQSGVTVGLTGVATGNEFPQTASFQYANGATTGRDQLGSADSLLGNEAEFPVGPQALVADFNPLAAVSAKSPVAALPSNKVSYFQPGLDYSGYNLNNTANNPFFIQPLAANVCPPACAPCVATCPTACPTANLSDQLAGMWLIFRYDNDSTAESADLISVSRADTVASLIENRAGIFQQTAADFLEDAGIDLNTHTRTGLGDVDVDLFYEHTFSKHLIGELMFGVRFPTAAKVKYCESPYAAQLGNNGHYEVKIGGMIAWKFARCIDLKFDTYYSFVLEKTENRMAAFQGAQIKNFGPCAKADVDWGYYVGRLDFTFFHPKTSNIRSMIGYEFYYKTKDDVDFKNRLQASLLGGQIVNGVLTPNLMPLDNCLAEKNTESIGHKVRGETSCQINDWFEIFAGATYTFAGQNLMNDGDAHGGFNVRF